MLWGNRRSGAEEAVPKLTGTISVAMKDGSFLRGTISVQQFDVETMYGKLTVPVSEIIRIRIGRGADPELKPRIDKLIAELGHRDFDVRQNAQDELAKLGALAIEELKTAANSADAEVAHRASALLTGLRSDDEIPPFDDEVETRRFPLRGTVKFDTLPVITPHGALRVAKKDILSLTITGADLDVSLDAGLVAHWKMDETDGDTVHDSGPHKLHGKLMEYGEADQPWVAGVIGNALRFNSATNYVLIPKSEDILNPGNRDWTIALWQKTSACAKIHEERADRQALVGKNDGSGKDLVLHIGINADPTHAEFWVSGPSFAVPAHGKSNVCDGKWHHLAGTRKGKTIRIYVDGRLETEVTDPTIPDEIASGAPLEIGRYRLWDGWAAPRFNGLIDDVRIYGRALNEQEIRALARPKPPSAVQSR